MWQGWWRQLWSTALLRTAGSRTIGCDHTSYRDWSTLVIFSELYWHSHGPMIYWRLPCGLFQLPYPHPSCCHLHHLPKPHRTWHTYIYTQATRNWAIISNSLLSSSYAQQLLNFGGNFQKILSVSLSEIACPDAP